MAQAASTPTNLRASDRLRADILAGAFGFGARLKIEDLARRYATSHMPIREALRSLHGEGLVVIEPNRGARVRGVDLDFVRNMFDLRAAIEAMLTRRAAERMGPAGLVRLEEIEAGLEDCAARGDVAGVLAANREFHSLIYAAAGNPEAVEIASRHWGLVAALWGVHGYDAARLPGVISDHRQILAAIAARDAESAHAIAAAHAAKAKQDLLRKMIAAGAAT